jgi:thioredoxin-dependent peroxiredoxin
MEVFMTAGDKITTDFRLKGLDAEGNEKEFSILELLKRKPNTVLYFYPMDDTPGCTAEACDFRDNMNRLTTVATVVGVSTDDLESHFKFRKKYTLNFILLSDPEKKLIKYFDVSAMLKLIRSTFLIGRDGTIEKEWRNVKVKGHVDEVLKSIS